MLGWTSWLSHKIFILAFRSSNLLPSTKKNAALAKLVRRHFLKVKTRWFEPNMQYKCGSSSVGQSICLPSRGSTVRIRSTAQILMQQQLNWLERWLPKPKVEESCSFYCSSINAALMSMVSICACHAQGASSSLACCSKKL